MFSIDSVWTPHFKTIFQFDIEGGIFEKGLNKLEEKLSTAF